MNQQRPERRTRRSDNLTQSLQLWLASIARRLRIPGFVLADQNGLVIATNFKGPRADELAAAAPRLVRADQREIHPLDRLGVPLSILPLEHRGGAMLLCALGDRVRRATGARVAAHGIQRILREQRLEI